MLPNLAVAKVWRWLKNRLFAELKTAPCQTTLPSLKRCSTLICGNLAHYFRRQQIAEWRHQQSKQDFVERTVSNLVRWLQMCFSNPIWHLPTAPGRHQKFSPIPIAGSPPKKSVSTTPVNFCIPNFYPFDSQTQTSLANEALTFPLPVETKKAEYRNYLFRQNWKCVEINCSVGNCPNTISQLNSGFFILFDLFFRSFVGAEFQL